MSSPKVIIFGPTGAVGSSAARTAAELGATVVLAMRDTSKSIPGLDEKQGKFERVQADLTKPDSVREAITSTGAKRAFFYLAHGMPNGMRSTVEALKSAGIELPVFLSSFTVQGDLKAIEQAEAIPFVHAQVELNLDEVFGKDGYVAARPGGFASNMFQRKAGVLSGQVDLFAPDATVDCIAPEDIGRVCGTILAKGPQDEQRKIYLYGPKLLTQRESVEILAKVLGKDPKIVIISKEDAYKEMVEQHGLPPPVAKYMASRAETIDAQGLQVWGYPVKEDQLSNVEKYSGKKAMTLEEWVEKNKHLFAASASTKPVMPRD